MPLMIWESFMKEVTFYQDHCFMGLQERTLGHRSERDGCPGGSQMSCSISKFKVSSMTYKNHRCWGQRREHFFPSPARGVVLPEFGLGIA